MSLRIRHILLPPFHAIEILLQSKFRGMIKDNKSDPYVKYTVELMGISHRGPSERGRIVVARRNSEALLEHSCIVSTSKDFKLQR
jgi:hypothetical protein